MMSIITLFQNQHQHDINMSMRVSTHGCPLQANDTINMLEAEVDELQAELAATQAVAAKHQRTAAASGQEIKVLQRLSSSGDISFMRTHSQTGRRSTTGHRYSEQGIPSFGSHDDLIHLQVCSSYFVLPLCMQLILCLASLHCSSPYATSFALLAH